MCNLCIFGTFNFTGFPSLADKIDFDRYAGITGTVRGLRKRWFQFILP